MGCLATWESQLVALLNPRTRQPTTIIIMGLSLAAPRDFLLQVDSNSRWVLTALDSFRL